MRAGAGPLTAPGSFPGFSATGFAAGFGFSTSSSMRRPDLHALRAGRENVGLFVRRQVVFLEQQPVLLAGFAGLRLQPRQHPAAIELFAGEAKLERTGLQAFLDIVHRRPDAGVPDDHRPAAILALGDHALEVDIFERVVLGLDGEPLVGRIERRPLRHRPALQHVADLEPQIVVVGGRVMLVDDETVAAVAGGAPGRLACFGEIALRPVGTQFGRHQAKLCAVRLARNIGRRGDWVSLNSALDGEAKLRQPSSTAGSRHKRELDCRRGRVRLAPPTADIRRTSSEQSSTTSNERRLTPQSEG